MNSGSLIRNVLLLLLVFTASCVTLPEHGKPKFVAPESIELTDKKGFTYRQLKRKDFQARSLPAESRQYRHNIGAQSCISIRPSEGSKISIVQSHYQGMLFYAGSLAQLTFEAIFVPDCSWWNPGIARSKEEYVLQHEQIHFALAELAARKLSSEARSEMQDYLAIGNDYNEVQEEIIEKLREMGRQLMEMNIKEHTDFDEDTSLFYDPRAQQRWLENVNIRLAAQNSG